MVASGGLGFLVVLPSSHFSDLINGSRKGFFVASRGLRQGDPLSPFLYTLVAEALTQILSTREEKNLFKWFRVGKEEILISHLQYAGHTLLLMEGDKNQVPKSLIHCFELVSGMKINWKKSCLVGLNSPSEEYLEISDALNRPIRLSSLEFL